ncbi:MAG: hypothetical protein LBL99_00800, partial [Holosporaceae bacterium]|nr:hypothetical protein [Holosporaceae bacterium]
HNCFEDEILNEISANIKFEGSNVDGAFNEKAFATISVSDVEECFERLYKKCPISIVASGAVNIADLTGALRSTTFTMEPRKPAFRDHRVADQLPKEINIESKYVGRAARYFYKVPKEDIALANAFFEVLSYELFNYLEKANPMILDFGNFNALSNGDCVRQIVLYPKSDVALVDLQKAYEVFIDRICSQIISTGALSKVKTFKKYAERFIAEDLYAVYLKIKNDRLNGVDREIDLNDPKQFSSVGEKLKKNLIIKIVSRYKPDK